MDDPLVGRIELHSAPVAPKVRCWVNLKCIFCMHILILPLLSSFLLTMC